ncbi:hypothetical protein JTE90_007759 [Oedothorax gibbosus]|uniref:Uncharacterized protein n=1 Tax=Oedothorax gibbosus TaxID=931172 RepID=A0AAV6UAZ8_9ARAC|nr:hypothetical protein JTE90_007759 [Oedothorax gibbosus]
MNNQFLFTLFFVLAVTTIHCRETNSNNKEGEGDSDSPTDSPPSSWWSGFKARVKSVLSRWKEDIKLLWDDAVEKARDMKGWTSEVLDSLKVKLREWVETRKELPDDEKNEIETFISKLKVPTDAPGGERKIDKKIDLSLREVG